MSGDSLKDYCLSFYYCMYGSDVDSVNVDLEFFQSGEILSVPLLHLAPNHDENENEGDSERKVGPAWELAQLGFLDVAYLNSSIRAETYSI